MTNEEKILEILTGMQGEIKHISSRLDSLESKVDSLESKVDSLESKVDSLESKVDSLAESHAEVRTSVNAILDWTDTVSTVVPIVPKIS